MPDVKMVRGVKLQVDLENTNARRKVLSIPGVKLSKDETKAYFPLEPTIIDDLRNLFGEGVQLDSITHDWYHRLRGHMQNVAGIATQTDVDMTAPDWSSQLRPYQRVGATWLAVAGRGLLGDEPGLGKTVQAITATTLSGSRRTLVVAPGYLLFDQWQRQIRLWSPNATITVASGTAAQRSKALQRDAQFTLINPEMLRRPDAYPELWDGIWDTVILDEAHHYQGRSSQQSHGAADLRTHNLYLLTGSPVWNNVDSIWHLLHLIDPHRFSSYWSFVEAYCTLRQRPWGLEIVGPNPAMLNRLREVIGPLMLRRCKEDVAKEIPPKIYVNLTYDLSKQQLVAYRQMHKELLLESDTQSKSYVSRGALISDLRLLCTAPSLLGFENGASKKDDLILKLLEDLEGVPTIIFVWYRKYAAYLHALLTEHKIDSIVVTGDAAATDRTAAINRFRRGDVNVLIATIASVGEGVDLDNARAAIFAELHYVPAVNLQAEDRLHRLTTHVSPTIYRLYAQHTVEQHIVDVTETKSDISSEVLAVNEIIQRLAADEV